MFACKIRRDVDRESSPSATRRSPDEAQRDARGLLSLVEGLLLQLARRDIGPAEASMTITRFVAAVFTH